MRPITAELLVAAVGCSPAVAQRFADPIAETCRVWSIDSPRRLSAFLAQMGHETLSFTALVENLNYGTEALRNACLNAPKGSRWRSLLPRVNDLVRQPQRLAEAAYGGRMGNGPEGSGDGWLFRGRGMTHITGRTNYEAVTEGLSEKLEEAVPDFVLHPDLLAEPKWAALSGGCYWNDRRLNDLADKGNFELITERINGGQNGAADRRIRLNRAVKALAS